MPSWDEIEEKTSSSYAPYSTEVSPLIYIPVINIVLVSKIWKNPTTRIHTLQ